MEHKPLIALTFDDGPAEHTPRLLDILKKNGAKATFFIVGNLIEGGKAIIKRAYDEGHEIGNHTFTHAHLTYIPKEDILSELSKTSEALCEITGEMPKLSRPPYGSYNETVAEAGRELGLAFINWTVNTMDWSTQNADAVHKEIMSTSEGGFIMLCHDSHKSTVDAMERVVVELIEKGFELVTVSELMAHYGKPLSAGDLYESAN